MLCDLASVDSIEPAVLPDMLKGEFRIGVVESRMTAPGNPLSRSSSIRFCVGIMMEIRGRPWPDETPRRSPPRLLPVAASSDPLLSSVNP